MAALPKLLAGVNSEFPATGGFAITVPGDDLTDLTEAARRVYAGGAGNISVLMLDGTGPFLFAFAAGEIKNISISRVRNSGTTATTIIGLR